MKLKYTPGTFETGHNDPQVIYAGDLRIASVECSRKEWRHNAVLLKAAPDMLKALRHVSDYLKGCCCDRSVEGLPSRVVWDVVQSALSKVNVQ